MLTSSFVWNKSIHNPEWTPQDDSYIFQQLSLFETRVIFCSDISGQTAGDE